MPQNPGGYVYGTILVATLLAAEARGREGYGRVAVSVALALFVYWLAISYAEDMGHRAGASEHFSPRAFLHTALHELAVVIGALGPLVALLLAWASGARVGTGISAAIWSAAGIIVLTEVGLGLRSHLDGRDLVVQTGFGIVLGLLVIGLRVLLH